jgi:hypothetical protein
VAAASSIFILLTIIPSYRKLKCSYWEFILPYKAFALWCLTDRSPGGGLTTILEKERSVQPLQLPAGRWDRIETTSLSPLAQE